MKDAKPRGNSKAFGSHRVLDPMGALPQSAETLDVSRPIFENEVLIDVSALNIDSAAFEQMREQAAAEGARNDETLASAIGDMIFENVRERGKQVNPVTGSGGMLLGTVAEVGPRYRGPCKLKIGDRLATLVSLTLTPLFLETVIHVHLHGPRHAQVDVKGYAILVDGSPAAVLPDDLPEMLALSVLDVCGAPAQVNRLVQPGQTVVIVGAGGKSGLLCLHQARKRLGKSGQLLAIDYSDKGVLTMTHTGLADVVGQADARNALEVYNWVYENTKGRLADWVFNCANLTHTEMGCILSARDGGGVYFFNMATDFARAALGAEGVGKDVALLIGNGFTPGHAELALQIMRDNKILRELFSK